MEIEVDGCTVSESRSERLLGIIMNNTLTWEHHLYGDKENKGLIEKLSYRASLVSKLSHVMPTNRLKTMAEGLFFSVLNYGIEVYANTWTTATLDEQNRNSMAFNKEDNRKLQILVNKVLRYLTNMDYEASTKLLHEKSDQLSVHQRCAYFSLVSMHKVLKRDQPAYHRSRFVQHTNYRIETRNRSSFGVHYKLSLSRCSYFYRSSRLYNLLPDDLVIIDKLELFKKRVKNWVKMNISLSPT